jgi:hypothetical protein
MGVFALIDLASEQVFPLSAPPPWLVGRTGRPVHRSTLERWSKTGVRGGVRLESALLGVTRVSSVEAVERFMAQLNGLAPTPEQTVVPTSKPTRTSRQRDEASEAALSRLVKAGYGEGRPAK